MSSDDRTIHNLALAGFMGTGKTSVGRLVAGILHFEFVDTDEMIETQTGRRIAQIFTEDGEPAFRKIESEMVRQLSCRRNLVISTGGGLILNQDNLDSLKQHAWVVCLWASAETIYHRIRNQTHRPLLQCPDPLARIRELLGERDSAYRQADMLLNCEARPLREMASHLAYQFRSVLPLTETPP